MAIGGCDKNMPACVMAMARMDRPSVFVYGGTDLYYLPPLIESKSNVRRWTSRSPK